MARSRIGESINRRISSVELTDDSGGEKLARHPVGKGELILGDRAYLADYANWGLVRVKQCR